ncbi:MAG: hypothetical protein QNK37_29310 [Acidobacteriota bacterium]|nr:hypothetical protein [Acidobacteriota bacterium]
MNRTLYIVFLPAFLPHFTFAQITAPEGVCSGEVGYAAQVEDAGPDAAYAWTLTNGNIDSGQGTTQITFSPDGGGDVLIECTVTVAGDDTLFQDTVSFYETPAQAYAGPDQVSCATGLMLAATAPELGTGHWTIFSGRDGVVADPTDPASAFTGTEGERYELEWRVANGPCTRADTVILTITETFDVADAGPDQQVCGETTTLQGNAPDWGAGIWTVTSGRSGSFDDPYDPASTFSGLPGETYVLRWTLRGKPCEVSYDEVVINLAFPQEAFPGTDFCLPQGMPFQLQGSNRGQGGSWSIIDGPNTDLNQISDTRDPHARFTPTDLGDYVLAWSTSTPICGDEESQVLLSVSEPRIVPDDLGMLPPSSNYSYINDDADIRGYAAMDHAVYFSALDWRHGQELWRTDGTSSGTSLVKDFRSNGGISEAAFDHTSGQPTHLTRVGDTLFFAIGPYSDERLFSLREGEVPRHIEGRDEPIIDIKAMASLDGVLYFAANRGESPGQLWRSDGTRQGTFPLYGRVPGLPTAGIEDMIVFNGKLIFAADYVWSFDPAANRVDQLTTTRTGIDLTAEHNGLLYFTYYDYDRTSSFLWRTDGTPTGTVELSELKYLFRISYLTPAGPFLYFLADEPATGVEIWRTDGTVQGTVLVENLYPADQGFRYAKAAAADDRLVVAAEDGVWVSDGTLEGTKKLVDLQSRWWSGVISMGNEVYFSANGSNTSGIELWKSDGTPAGTVLVKDISPGSKSSSPNPLFVWNDALYFTADHPDSGRELWRTGGTAATTELVKDINDDRTTAQIDDFGVQGDRLLFGMRTPENDIDLFAADDEGIGILSDIEPLAFHPYGDTMLMVSQNGLYRLDEGAREPRLIKPHSIWYSSNDDFFTYNGVVYFRLDTDATGAELYRTDGTEAGTYLVKELVPGYEDGFPGGFFEWNGLLYFRGYDGSKFHLYRSDGTAAGTVPAFSEEDIPNVSSADYFPAEDLLFFSSSYNGQLHVTDGTAEGTTVFPESFSVGRGITSGNRFFFVGWTFATGNEPWISDGTEAGTFLLREIYPGSEDSNPKNLTRFGRYILFTATAPDTGEELWITDGTPEGTTLAADLFPGEGGSSPEDLTPFGDKVYFTANIGESGRELAYTDGWCATLVQDAAPGPGSAVILDLFAGSDALFGLRADDGPRLIRLQTAPVNLPDGVLRDYALNQFDRNGDRMLTESEARTVTRLDLTDRGVVSLSGIGSFPNLEVLLAADNQISNAAPLLSHPNLGDGPEHLVDLRGNYLGAEDCTILAPLRERLEASGGELLVEPQRGVFGFPTYEQWPRYNILEIMNGTILTPEPLPCSPKRRKEVRR